jgi:hypothetical protein
MARIPGQNVSAPEPGNPRYGLFAVASGPLGLPTPHGLGGGVQYEPVSCGSAVAYALNCLPPADQPDNPAGDGTDGVVTALPFAVMSALECGSLGYTGPEFEDRVRRRLESAEQGAVELALWTGEDGNGDTLTIGSLDSEAEEITGDSDDAAGVVSALENYAYNTQGYGFNAVIHSPVGYASYMAEAGLVVKDGKFLRTPYGSFWAFGGGYPLEGRMFVSGQLTVWRAEEILVYPADLTLNRTTNQRHMIAAREYAVGIDCFVGSIDVDIIPNLGES